MSSDPDGQRRPGAESHPTAPPNRGPATVPLSSTLPSRLSKPQASRPRRSCACVPGSSASTTVLCQRGWPTGKSLFSREF